MINPRESNDHPVFLRSTGNGAGGIATLMLDGAHIRQLLNPLVRARKSLFDARNGDLLYGQLIDSSQAIVDEVVLALVVDKESSTGNEQIELSCHGGEGAVAAVEETLLQAGFSAGRGTELLERAHLNGKLSLIAIEARLRLAQALTARQIEFLLAHTELQQRWEKLGFDLAMGLRTKDNAWRQTLLNAAVEASAATKTALALLTRHTLVLAGPVNAGKSTLANLLARADRHIVSEIPGTTLDRLDTPIALRGMNLLLTDTAGLRESSDAVEKEGQRRGLERLKSAELRLVVLDGSKPPTDADVELLHSCKTYGPTLLVLNKYDLGMDANAQGLSFLVGREPALISAKSGFGLEALETQIEISLLGPTALPPDAPFTQRQLRHLVQIHKGLNDGVDPVLVLNSLRKLVGRKPDPEELAVVLSE